jgi:hypothetical protein
MQDVGAREECSRWLYGVIEMNEAIMGDAERHGDCVRTALLPHDAAIRDI